MCVHVPLAIQFANDDFFRALSHQLCLCQVVRKDSAQLTRNAEVRGDARVPRDINGIGIFSVDCVARHIVALGCLGLQGSSDTVFYNTSFD